MFLLFVAGLVLTIIGYVYLSQVIADRRGLLWGLSIFVIPPIAAVYSVAYWKNARPALLAVCAGIIVTVLSVVAGAWPDVISRLESKGYGDELSYVTDAAQRFGFYTYGYRNEAAPPSVSSGTPVSTAGNVATVTVTTAVDGSAEEKTSNYSRLVAPPSKNDDMTIAERIRYWKDRQPKVRYEEKVRQLEKKTYQARDVYRADKYMGHSIRLKLHNGLQRQAVLVDRDGDQLVLKHKHKAFSGFVSYRVNISDVNRMFVELPVPKV